MSTTFPRIARTTGQPDQRFTDEPRQTVCLRLSPAIRGQVDAFAKRRGMKRTAVIEEALRFYMAVKALDGDGRD